MPRIVNAWNGVFVLAFAVIFLAVVYPMFTIFRASFVSPETGGWSLESYRAIFHYPFYRRCLENSLFVSVVSTALSVAIGVPFAFFLSRYEMPGKNVIKTLATLPLILPTFIGAEAWLLLAGRNGLFFNLFQKVGVELPSIYGWKGIVLVFTLQFFPYVFLMVSAAINSIDRSLEEAATNLGAGRLRVFLTVTVPTVTPAVLAGALIVFYLSIENFGVPILIGEDFRVLSVQAYNEFISEMGGNPSMAGALSTVLLVVTMGLTLLQKYWVERKSYAMSAVRRPEVVRARPVATLLMWLFCAGIVFTALFPFVVVMVSSVTKTSGPVMYYGEFSLENFVKAFTIAPRPIVNSFFLATVSTLLGIVFGLLVSYLPVRRRGKMSHLLDAVVMPPLAVAGTVQGIALAATYNTGFIVLTGTWMILAPAHFIRKVPFSIKTTSPLLEQIDRSVEEASINLGVPPFALLPQGGGPHDAPGDCRRGHHHVGDDPGRAEFHHCPVLRPLGDDDRGDFPADGQRRVRPRLGLCRHPHRLRPHPAVFPAAGYGQGPDHHLLKRGFRGQGKTGRRFFASALHALPC